MAQWSAHRAPLPGNWAKIRAFVLRRDLRRCRLRYEDVCTERATEVDHIDRNDDHRPENLRAVCTECHRVRTQQQAAEGTRAAWARTRPRKRKHPGLL